MAETKYTKVDALNEIKEAMADNANVVAYCDNELALIDKKNAKARERAAAKRAEGDELQAQVLAVITDAPQTRDDILAAMNDESGELTVGKIQAKLNNLVEAGKIAKCKVKTEDGKQKTAYTIAE